MSGHRAQDLFRAGRALPVEGGDPEAALELPHGAVEIDPECFDALVTLAQLAHDIDEIDMCLHYAHRAVRLARYNTEAREVLSRAFFRKRDHVDSSSFDTVLWLAQIAHDIDEIDRLVDWQ